MLPNERSPETDLECGADALRFKLPGAARDLR
jgi:hypothetical protein